MEDIDEAADAPFVARTDCGRAVLTVATGSDLVEGQGPALCGFFRAAVAVQPPTSLAAGINTPFVWVFDCVIVVLEEEEERDEAEDALEVIEDDELARCALFRGMNIRATSASFIELSPP